MNREELKQLFKNNSDCYADTWIKRESDYYPDENKMVDGEVIQAMTEDKFVEVVTALSTHTTVTAGEIEAELFRNFIRTYHLTAKWDNFMRDYEDANTIKP